MSFEKNIKLYSLYSTFAELLILGPILVLFLTAKGLSFAEILLLQSISSIAVVIFEVPTGAIADKVSRKLSLFLGSFLWGISLIIYCIGTNFIVFSIAEIIFSLGSSLKSGADNALIYDTLKTLGKEKDFTTIEGKARGNLFYSQAIGSIIAGFVYDFNIYLPMIISCLFMIITMIITLFFKEPPHKIDDTSNPDYFTQIKDSGKFILNHSKVKAVVLFSMIFAIFYRTGFWYFQPYMEAVNIPVKYFGIIFFIFNIFCAFISKKSGYIMNKTKPRTLSFMASLIIISFILMGIFPYWFGVFFILFQQAARALYRPVTTKYLNKHIPSEKRATILSFNSLCSNLAVSIFFPILGLLKDNTDVFLSHLIMAGLMLLMLIPTMIYMNSHLGIRENI